MSFDYRLPVPVFNGDSGRAGGASRPSQNNPMTGLEAIPFGPARPSSLLPLSDVK